MKLGATITSERGKAITKTGNESIIIELNVHGIYVGEIELYLHNDNVDEKWIVLYRKDGAGGAEDPYIVAQGNIAAKKNGSLKHGKAWEESECLHCGPRKDLGMQGLTCPHK